MEHLCKQEVRPPGSADTVCPRRPRMTQMQHSAKTAHSDYVTLRPWPLTLEVMAPSGWCDSSSSIRIPSLKFVGLAVQKIWCAMCVSINWPGDLVLWPFDLETGTRVALKVRNIHSKFGHPRLSGYPVIRYQILLAWDHPVRRYCILKMLRRWTVSALRVLGTPSTSVSHRNQTDGVRLLKFSG